MKSGFLRAVTAGTALVTLGAGLATTPTAQGATTLTSKEQLKSASVPSMCGHPAGTLKDGKLPGYPVSLDYAKSRLGQIKLGGGKEAAAVLHCSQGGVGWPDHIVFYATNGAIVGHFNTASVGGRAGRQSVRAVSIGAKGVVTAHVLGVPLKGDNALWGSAGARLTFKWDAKKKKVVRTSATIYDNTKGVANKILSLAKSGKVSQAKKYATASIVKELVADWKRMAKQNKTAKRKGTIKIAACGGPSSTYKGTNFFTWPMQKGEPEQFASWSVMTFNHKKADTNWTSWYARKLIGVAG